MAKKTAKIIDGKKLAEDTLITLMSDIKALGRHPGLAAILIGDDEPSKLYIKNKRKAAERVGINFYDYRCGGETLPNVTQEEILAAIDFLNKDPEVNGIIVQLPIPEKFDTKTIINRIDPSKDVDGFQPQDPSLLSEKIVITPPLIGAVTQALTSTGEPLMGKHAVIVSKNPIFSQPMGAALEKLGIKVETITPDTGFDKITKKADILIVIVGKVGIVNKSMVKPGAIVIDVGTNSIGGDQFAGDVDPEVAEVAGWLTPVPGGIGPLTVAMLLKSTYELSLKQYGA